MRHETQKRGNEQLKTEGALAEHQAPKTLLPSSGLSCNSLKRPEKCLYLGVVGAVQIQGPCAVDLQLVREGIEWAWETRRGAASGNQGMEPGDGRARAM